MLHIIAGLFLIALGIWGIYDEFFYVAAIIGCNTSFLCDI